MLSSASPAPASRHSSWYTLSPPLKKSPQMMGLAPKMSSAAICTLNVFCRDWPMASQNQARSSSLMRRSWKQRIASWIHSRMKQSLLLAVAGAHMSRPWNTLEMSRRLNV